jgi:arabinogalactan oligomer/maltooligosaccharide transport system permease protein
MTSVFETRRLAKAQVASSATPKASSKKSRMSPEDAAALARRKRSRSVGMHLTLALATLIALFPVVFIVANSFKPENEILRRLDSTGSPVDQAKAVVEKALPTPFTLDNYSNVLDENAQGEREFFGWFVNSVVIAFATCVIGIFLAATAGYALSRFRFPGYRPTLYMFLVTQMFPAIILIVPLYNIMAAVPVRRILFVPAVIGLVVGLVLVIRKLRAKEWYGGIAYVLGGVIGVLAGLLLPFSGFLAIAAAGLLISSAIYRSRTPDPRLLATRAGVFSLIGFGIVAYLLGAAPTELRLLDNRWGLVLAYSTIAVPFCVYMLKGYFDTIPYELEQAALVDGLTPFGTFWRIACPLALPGIAVTAFYSFITAWNEFMYAITFNLQSKNYTLPAGLSTYVSEFRTEWGQFSAAAVLVSIPALAFFFVAQRYLVGGLTAGGTKS